ncbi:MAG: ribonuclease R family protein [Solirubrobacteraceae bacterium]
MSDAVVAVLEKRGRFWTAEPLFRSPRSADGGRGSGASRRLALGSNRVAGARGETARGETARGETARAGDLVLVRLPGRAADRNSPARASIARVLGRPDVARDLIEGLMLDRGLERRFEQGVEREARAAAMRVPTATDGRRDLTGLPTFTIDPVSARDFDDAISAEWLPDGRAHVWVHIADVSAYVPEGSPVDEEARRRGTSVYVPGAVEPMLPEALSNDACSLQPGVVRAAVTVELKLFGGKITKAAFYRSLIRSDERLSYERVDEIFAGRARAAEPWGEPLQVAREVAAARGKNRRERHSGALTLDTSEPEFVFDRDGHVVDVRECAQTESHRLIEHLMIAANEAVARRLSERREPCLYRIHPFPELERVKRLIDQLASLSVPTPPAPDNLSPSQAAALMGEISERVEAHVRAVAARARDGEAVAPSGGRAALTSLVLRSLQQASYFPKNRGHSGLGTSYYCHFTSPIRRYPDLVCHRALLATVGAGEHGVSAAGLKDLAEWTSDRERFAMGIERRADDVARCFALERALHEGDHGRSFAGEVVGLIPAGAFVAFAGYRGMLPVRRLRGSGGRREWWELNEQGTILQGDRPGSTLRLGDPIEVRVARVDVARGRVDLIPAG